MPSLLQALMLCLAFAALQGPLVSPGHATPPAGPPPVMDGHNLHHPFPRDHSEGVISPPPPSPPPRRATPPLPWAEVARQALPPAVPGLDYRPAFVPDGVTLGYRVVGGVKVFHLKAEPIEHEFLPGLRANCWGYNGRTPGPLIEAAVGDRVRILVTNRLPAPTTVHWHGMKLPSGMDGPSGLNQPPIPPGETYVYEFWLPEPGTFMYHSHHDDMTQQGMGLAGMLLVHPRGGPGKARDFAILLQEWRIDAGHARPNTQEMIDFNILTMNGKAYPATHPLVVSLGDLVRVRFGNLSPTNHHPVHVHGHAFRIVATDGGPIPVQGQWPETTVLVPVGTTRDVEFIADNPGDWFFHCHMTHHTMNQMGHDAPNMVGVDPRGVEERIARLVPGYMVMGTTGMEHEHAMPVPENSAPMLPGQDQFGPSMGGMATVLKVREGPVGYEDPGPYTFPEGTVARKATPEEMREAGIRAP
jgi:manganese oxidase